MFRASIVLWVVVVMMSVAACQSPTDPDDTFDVDDVIDVSVSPDPILADNQTGGRTYRVVRGNNQPDEIVQYDWHAAFSITARFNNNATDEDVDVAFPVKLSSTTLVAKQASGGIITAPTGTDVEHSEFVTVSASGNQLGGVDAPVTLSFEVWYDLPSLRKEAVMSVLLTFVDDDGAQYQRVIDATVAP